MSRFISRGCGILALLLLTGCGKSGPVSVRGVVKLDGQPVVGAAVTFIAQDPGGRDAYGSTDENGAFELSTTKPGDGVLPGKYKVVIQPPGEGGGSTPFDDTDKPAAPAKPKAPRGPQIPLKYTVPAQTPLAQDVPPNGKVVIELESK
jgi:hypothetical protein